MKNNEVLQQANDIDISQKIRFVSHEIRNHLSVCEMYSRIIKRNLEKEGVRNNSIENALDCIQKSVQIIGSNVMDLKSINNNVSKVHDFETLITGAVELSKAYTEDKEIEFFVFIKNSADILVDENRFISCVVNVIKNGIEAIEMRGKISILGEIKNNTAILKISNTGKPIPPSRKAQIFNTGFTTKSGGCGLGLSICFEYLKSQGAELKLNKSTKTETQFEITVPVYSGC